jgi:hypothetical protein
MIFIKKCFVFTVGSVCCVKRFTTGSRNCLKERSKVADDETEVRKWLIQQLKRILCCGIRRAGKAIGQVYQCCRRVCREINVFFPPGVRISNVLRFISICDLFTHSYYMLLHIVTSLKGTDIPYTFYIRQDVAVAIAVSMKRIFWVVTPCS